MDITYPIQPVEITQNFGDNPGWYTRFGIKAHNGIDYKTKYPDTPKGQRYILSPWLSKFYRSGNEGNDGYGIYFETIIQLYNTYKLTFAHCLNFESFTERKEGEHMGISDNTGNSTGSHLHLTVKIGKIINNKFIYDNANNGYFGAINPQIFFDELRKFKYAKPQPTGEDVIVNQLQAIINGNDSPHDKILKVKEVIKNA